MSTELPIKIKDQATLRYNDTFALTGDLYKATYTDGSDAILLATEEGYETISVNLIAYGYIPNPGAVFVSNDFPDLAQSLADTTGGTIARTVPYGPFDSTATEVILEADQEVGRFDWVGWEAEPETTGDGSGDPEKHFLTIRDPHGEEYALIVHRTVGGRYPLDGALASEKVARADAIVAALNGHGLAEHSGFH